MKEINLNGKAKIKLNEKGLKRVEELVEKAGNTDMMSDYGKSVAIQEIRKCVDEEGYLTNSLNTIMGDFDVSCFDSLEFSMQDIDSHEWFTLNLADEVTIKLNGRGVRRTIKIVSDISRDNILSYGEKKGMLDEIESSIDDDNNLTASLGYIISNYSEASFEYQIAKISDEPSVTRGSR